MAMNTLEAVATVRANSTKVTIKANNTEAEPVAAYKLTATLIRLVGSYLNDADLEKFSKLNLSLFPTDACIADVNTRIYIRDQILTHVFAADPMMFETFLVFEQLRLGDSMSLPQVLLTKTGFNEEYQSETLGGKIVSLRQWLGVSALTAAAYSGDLSFVVLQIIALLLKADENRTILKEEDSYRFQAMQQLQEVEERITEQTLKDFTLLSEAASALVDRYFGENRNTRQKAKQLLEEHYKSKEFKCLIEDQSIVEEAIAAGFKPIFAKVKPSATKVQEAAATEQKTLSESKENVEDSQIKYADNAEFLTPVLRLLKAYLNIIIQSPKLRKNNDINTLDTLWEVVSECHKRLFYNVLQEYFDPEKPFEAYLPVDFCREPKRAPLVYLNGEYFNFSSIGCSTIFGLHKISTGGERCVRRAQCVNTKVNESHLTVNFASITPYFKHRTTGLKNIIEQLKTPEKAAALVVAYANNSQAARKSGCVIYEQT